MFVTQGVWCAADQTEESIATRFDVGAVLDVGVRPEPGRRLIIALVEQGVERLQYQGFVLFGCRLRHSDLHSGGSAGISDMDPSPSRQLTLLSGRRALQPGGR